MKNLIKAVCFLTILFSIIHFLNLLYIPKTSIWGKAPYYEKENSLDVVFIGSSHVEWGIDPNVIWEEYGIPSINYAIPSLDIKYSYFLMKEIFKYQKPKVIVVDVYRINDRNIHEALTNRLANAMSFSVNRFEMINSNDSFSLDQKLDYYFPLYLYHSRKLEKNDFNFSYINAERGHFINFDNVKEDPKFEDISDTLKLDQENRYYIDRLINLARENNASLLFVKIPHLKASPHIKKEWNAAFSVAKQHGIPFIDFNKEENFKVVGLDYKKDIANDSPENGHLNHNGSVKLSRYLGNFLKDKYNMPNKKSDFAYSHLNTLIELYKAQMPKREANNGNIIEPGVSLYVNGFIESENKIYKLFLREDGNLVLLKNGSPIWATHTTSKNVTECIMQTDGNFVLYDKDKNPHWDSRTFNPNSYLKLQDNGNIEIIKDGLTMWQSNTSAL